MQAITRELRLKNNCRLRGTTWLAGKNKKRFKGLMKSRMRATKVAS